MVVHPPANKPFEKDDAAREKRRLFQLILPEIISAYFGKIKAKRAQYQLIVISRYY